MAAQFTRRAKVDLAQIWCYVAESSHNAADNLLDEIMQCCENLDQSPGIGGRCYEYGDRLRRFTVSSYVIYYIQTTPHIEIVRILHGARDIDQIL